MVKNIVEEFKNEKNESYSKIVCNLYKIMNII